jgi:DNA-directed RNA polymerase specialized sigma24 family protein
MLYRYMLVHVKDPDVADELVQATLFAALKLQHTFSGKSTEKIWLFGILKHKTMDHLRSAKKISISTSPVLTQTVFSLTQRGV